MGSMQISEVVHERMLQRESFADAQVASYWIRAATSLADAQAKGLSVSSALHLACVAALRLSVVMLAAHGMRVGAVEDDRVAFAAAERLEGAMGHHAGKLDALWLAGERWTDEPEYSEDRITEQLGGAIVTLREAFSAVRAEILSIRPGLAPLLTSIEC